MRVSTETSSVKFERFPTYYKISEIYKNRVVFSHLRSFNGDRSTEVQRSFVGLTLLDRSKDTLYITEGLSDFIALKLLLPEENVIAHTDLSLSKYDTNFIIHLGFKTVCYLYDNDVAGLKAAAEIRTKLLQRQRVKLVSVYPGIGAKDTCDVYLKSRTNKEIKEYVVAHYKTL